MEQFKQPSPEVLISCIILTLIHSLNYFITDCQQLFALVPINTFMINKHAWNLITSSFYETDFLKVISNIAFLIYAMKDVKFNYNRIEYFGFYLIINMLISNIIVFIYSFTVFFTSQNEIYITQSTYGFLGVFISYTMFARQQLKAQPVSYFFPFITYHNYPIILLLFQIVFWLLGFVTATSDIAFGIVSLFTTWSYLRFYYVYDSHNGGGNTTSSLPLSQSRPQGGGLYGDDSDEFSFVNMFPTVSIYAFTCIHIVYTTTILYNMYI